MRNSISPACVATRRGRDPVALRDTGASSLIAVSADPFRGFDLDQLLHNQPDRVANEVDSLASAKRLQQLGGQTETGPSVTSPSVCTWRYTPRTTPMVPPCGGPLQQPQNPTTQRDAPSGGGSPGARTRRPPQVVAVEGVGRGEVRQHVRVKSDMVFCSHRELPSTHQGQMWIDRRADQLR
jgi:hypothetical protein